MADTETGGGSNLETCPLPCMADNFQRSLNKPLRVSLFRLAGVLTDRLAVMATRDRQDQHRHVDRSLPY